MKMRILFYRAKFGDKKLLDNLISGWTGLFNWGTIRASHVEIWVADETKKSPLCEHGFCRRGTVFADGSRESHLWLGTCYTSTMRGDDNGTVKRPASGVLTHPERWCYVEVEVEELSCKVMLMVMDEMVKAKLSEYGLDAQGAVRLTRDERYDEALALFEMYLPLLSSGVDDDTRLLAASTAFAIS